MVEIKDGIVCKEEYDSSVIKMLWVLKEGNVAEKDETKSRDICEEIRTGWHIRNALRIPTFRKMIYATYGIFFPEEEWSNVPFANEDSAYNVLKQIAYININKMPGASKANYNNIKKAYEKYEKELLTQIGEYNPNIIVFGGTLHFFNTKELAKIGWNIIDTKKSYFDESKIGTTTSFFKISKDKLIINAYHPSYPGIKDKQYWLEIKSVAENWKKHFLYM